VGQVIATGVRRLIGAVAALLPPLLVLLAVRLMRAPGAPEHRGRALVGWTALTVAATGLLDVAQDPRTLVDREAAGGLLRRLGGVLSRAVAPGVAVPGLALLAVFGLLVVTAAPANRIPERPAYLLALPPDPPYPT